MLKQKFKTITLVIIFFAAFLVGLNRPIQAQTSAFTYQGKLTDGGGNANGSFDFAFRLFDAGSGGTQIGADVTVDDLQVIAGIFTVNLDFGASAFTLGANRFLEISVRPGVGTGAYTLLSPLQPITSVPFSIKSLTATSANNVTGIVSALNGGTGIGGTYPVAGTFLKSTGAGWIAGGVSPSDIPSNITVQAVNITGVLAVANGGTGSSTQNFVDTTTNQIRIGGSKEFLGTVSVAGSNGRFSGNGSGLTGVNAAVADGSVTTPKLANGSVTKEKLAVDFRNGFDPQNVAQMRWDLLPVQKNFFTVGRQPSALAFDGTFIYVANKLDNNVMRIRVSTGIVEGVPIPVGTAPSAIAYDGTFMNVANSGSNTVSRIRVSTGVIDGSPIAVGSNPQALAFDGTFIYVANSGGNNITKIRTTTGAVEGSPIAVGIEPQGLVFTGSFIYVSHKFQVSTATSSGVWRINTGTGAPESLPGLWGDIGAIAFDGTFVYVAESSFGNQSNGYITRINAGTGVREPISMSTKANGNKPLVFDGTFLYLGNVLQTPGSFPLGIGRLNINGLSREGNFIPVSGSGVSALSFDGTYIYAAVEVVFTDPNGMTTQVNGNVIRF